MTRRRINSGPTFWFSVILILVGIFLLLENLDIYYLGGLWDYWPLILVGIGVFRLLNSSFRDIYGGMMFIIFGGLLLLLTLDVYDFEDIWQFWPIILILIGGRIIYYKVILDPEERKQRTTISDDTIDHVAIFGGKEKRVTTNNFKGGNITAMFGGIDLFFGNAKLAQGENVLDVLVMFGGVEIYVPSGWTIITKGFPIFGGFQDARKNPPDEFEVTNDALIIKGLVLFGGLEIKDA